MALWEVKTPLHLLPTLQEKNYGVTAPSTPLCIVTFFSDRIQGSAKNKKDFNLTLQRLIF
jgi:hypothetical protein